PGRLRSPPRIAGGQVSSNVRSGSEGRVVMLAQLFALTCIRNAAPRSLVAPKRAMVCLPIVLVMLLIGPHPATADKTFRERDGAATPAYRYGYSGGGAESPYETPGRWELPGPFSLLPSRPTLQSLVFGPTFRHEENRTEVGGATAYVNSRWAVPFQFSVE